MSFNADAFRAALEPWTLTVGARRFVARPVSTPAVLAFHAIMARRNVAAATHRAALFRVLRRAFPWRCSYLWRGDPVRLLLTLEPAAQKAALADFFRHLGATPMPPPRSEMDGTSSPRKTRARTP